ncbi:lytic transglycosylase domain-containing protein [Dickeya dadantii]|uniref:lytic transglycosylase domain-containing protein n=1 Tax=Dickeya dadantii TaxID=204038 RepID=UPI0014961459|nr:lytic transglycosylase domain-containing protein [Dickeya dadantii]NPE55914.1 lytic transglycosylase domain-containing protein [Dickeya dadantii]NPE67138.1 lytic transglycosylase domain-containing protein [Dickeya dadantii]
MKRVLILFIFFFLFSSESIASTEIYDVKREMNFCFSEAGVRYQIDPLLLIAIAKVESGIKIGRINYNKNGTRDVGVMQINSSHFRELKEKWGITEDELTYNACQNIYVGAYILAKNISSFGVNWKAIGAYNAGAADYREPARIAYAKKIYNVYLTLLAMNRDFVIGNAKKGKLTI